MENNKTSFHKFMDATKGVKVDLALVDEADKIIQEAVVARKELIAFTQELNKISSLIDKALARAKDAEGVYEKGVSIGYKLASQMENLGIEPRSNTKYNELWDTINDVQTQFLSVRQKIKQLN